MEHYVTLFDSLFLPQGLALHASLQRHAGAHTLWILCMDERAHAVLSELRLPHVRLIALADVETPELRAVKPLRTRAEYCWTITPFTPRFVFEADSSVERVTYVDADTWLCRSPAPIFDEFNASGRAVLITEHGYAPEYDQSHSAGRFCVQFMTFVRGRGEAVRSWWAERCIEWCFARLEDGKFGDQKYLDDWPERFAGQVHVLQDKSLMQAPWNATRFAPGEAAVFHFHGLRLMSGGSVLLTPNYRLPRSTREAIYAPYCRDFAAAIQRLRGSGHEPGVQFAGSPLVARATVLARRLVAWARQLAEPRIVRL
jgi:hypothetical protein